jgi:hypothetical protein
MWSYFFSDKIVSYNRIFFLIRQHNKNSQPCEFRRPKSGARTGHHLEMWCVVQKYFNDGFLPVSHDAYANRFNNYLLLSSLIL